jgi:hypothetical protein
MLRHPPEGHTTECFSYAFRSTTDDVEESDEGFADVLLLTFWETFLFYAMFHDPACTCDNCYGPDLAWPQAIQSSSSALVFLALGPATLEGGISGSEHTT